jgi:3-oxoacyl-(acyl-carrier-protein) synthase/acyl carrier protein
MEAVKNYILQKFAATFKYDPAQLDLDENLMDMGLDSALIIKMAEDLESELGIKLYPTLFFEHKTLNEIIAYFSKEFPDAFEARKGQPLTARTPAPDIEAPFYLTLKWDKQNFPIDALAKTGDPVAPVMIMANDESEVKKHIFKKTIPGIQFSSNSILPAHNPATPDANRHFLVYVNAGKANFNDPALCTSLLSRVAGIVRDLFRETKAAAEMQRLRLSCIIESDDILTCPYLFAMRSLFKSIEWEYPFARLDIAGIEAFNQENIRWAWQFCHGNTLGCQVAKAGDSLFLLKTGDPQAGMTRANLPFPEVNATYLISGGGGKLALLLAGRLCDAVACNVVLLGRRDEPMEVNMLRANIKLGPNIVYKNCDITHLHQLKAAVRQVKEEYGPIRGVIHAAGVPGEGPFQAGDNETTKTILAPKVAGIVNLDLATAEEELGLFVALSSIDAMTGAGGQSDQAFANGFMDGFVRCRNSREDRGDRKGKSISISWPDGKEGDLFDAIRSGHDQLCIIRDVKYKADVLSRSSPGNWSSAAAGERAYKKPETILPGKSAAAPVDPPAMVVPADTRPASKQENRDEIAIIGMHGRFPGSPDLDTFWKNLVEEKDLITQTPKDRTPWWKIAARVVGFDEKDYIQWGGYLEGIDEFDADFFNISRREAEVMDPQQRLFLQSSWRCIEDAGYDPVSFSSSQTGVFAGVSTRDYHDLLLLCIAQIEPQHSTGLAQTMLANRVSYVLNLNGPSEIVDTACSSSLVAIHRAVLAIQAGECSCAIAGGVNLIMSPIANFAFSRTGILSKDGRCKTFASDANGYVRGEGVGTVLLKPLRQAVKDGDTIYAVIKASSLNHGGKGKGITAPNPVMQARVVSQALTKSGCAIDRVSYVEAHGTGTSLGDPIEIDGLKKAFKTLQEEQKSNPDPNYCGVGSVKSNIGHLEAAAGIAGIIKVLLSFKYGKLPASLHIGEVNPFIHLDNSPFYLVRKTRDWPRRSGPRIAGLSSFGFGGTNAHFILEEFLHDPEGGERAAPHGLLFPFSAPTRQQLQDYLALFSEFLRLDHRLPLENIAYTLQVGRTPLKYRRAFVATDKKQLLEKITEMLGQGAGEQYPADDLPGTLKNLLSTKAGQTFLETLFKDGELNNIALLWEKGLSIHWPSFYSAPPRRVSLPSFPFKKTKYWLSLPDLNRVQLSSMKDLISTQELPTNGQQFSSPTAEQVSSPTPVMEFLLAELAGLLKKDKREFDKDQSFLEYGMDSILGMSFVKSIEQRFNLRLYVNEMLQYDTLQKLSDYLAAEIRISKGESPASPAINKRPVVFLLSTPRAGSTLLRAMLMGHPALFAPPELHLLNFHDLRERSALLDATGLNEGLVETIRTLKGVDATAAKEWIAQLVNRGASTAEMYGLLQELLAGRILVDKSPSYAADSRHLHMAEEMFPNAKYLFLVRHPFAVMESIVRNRFHRFVPLADGDSPEPEKIAENIWYTFNRNIYEFSKTLPPDKYLFVHYEDLVLNPKTTAASICHFLSIPFDEEVLAPYKGDKMIRGLHQESLSIGDPNFLQHTGIDERLAFDWSSRFHGFPHLGEETLHLANRFGYDLGQDLGLSPQQHDFLASSASHKWNLIHEFAFEGTDLRNVHDLRDRVSALLERNPTLCRLLDEGVDSWRPAPDKQSLFEYDILEAFDLSEEKKAQLLQELIQSKKDKINISIGPLLYLGVLDEGDQKGRGVLIYSHLVGDGVSSIYLINNLVRILGGKQPEFPSIGNSYIRYLEEALEPEGPFTPASNGGSVDGEGLLHLPLDFENGPNVFTAERELDATIPFDPARGGKGSFFWIAGESLVTTLKAFTGASRIPLDIRYHNRMKKRETNGLFAGTIGLLAKDIPLQVDLTTAKEGENAFQRAYLAAKDKLPGSGAAIPNEIRFNFQAFSNLIAAEEGITIDNNSQYFDWQETRKNMLDFIVRERRSDWQLVVRYSSNHFRASTIESLFEQWKTTILRLI